MTKCLLRQLAFVAALIERIWGSDKAEEQAGTAAPPRMLAI
jgi:hypothetical protein